VSPPPPLSASRQVFSHLPLNQKKHISSPIPGFVPVMIIVSGGGLGEAVPHSAALAVFRKQPSHKSEEAEHREQTTQDALSASHIAEEGRFL
jgi:hypothetical protein